MSSFNLLFDLIAFGTRKQLRRIQSNFLVFAWWVTRRRFVRRLYNRFLTFKHNYQLITWSEKETVYGEVHHKVVHPTPGISVLQSQRSKASSFSFCRLKADICSQYMRWIIANFMFAVLENKSWSPLGRFEPKLETTCQTIEWLVCASSR